VAQLTQCLTEHIFLIGLHVAVVHLLPYSTRFNCMYLFSLSRVQILSCYWRKCFSLHTTSGCTNRSWMTLKLLLVAFWALFLVQWLSSIKSLFVN